MGKGGSFLMVPVYEGRRSLGRLGNYSMQRSIALARVGRHWLQSNMVSMIRLVSSTSRTGIASTPASITA